MTAVAEFALGLSQDWLCLLSPIRLCIPEIFYIISNLSIVPQRLFSIRIFPDQLRVKNTESSFAAGSHGQ